MHIMIEKKVFLILAAGILLVGCQRPSETPNADVPTRESVPSPSGVMATTSALRESAAYEQVEITFIDNEGFLITSGDKKILIDALYEGGGYNSSPPADILQQAIDGEDPFNGIDLLLVTHDHPDHFAASLVLEFMQNHPETFLVSTPVVIGELIALDKLLENRVMPVELIAGEMKQVEIADIQLEILYISHGDPELLNLGYIIDIQGTRLFHTGDLVADAVSVEDLQAYDLPQKQLNVAFLPFYMFQSGQYQAHITEGIQAQYLIPMHYSHKSPPISIDANFPEAIIFSQSMETWVYSPGP